jgi:DNA-binding NarL/FixJ family response regulator
MSALRVVVMANHPPIQASFADVARANQGRVLVGTLSLDARAVADASDLLGASAVAVVDASVDPAEAVAVCEAIGAGHPRLPIAAVFCCEHAAAAADLRGLLAAGVGGLLDLQLSAQETVRVLEAVARGEGAVHLQLAAGSGLLGLLDSENPQPNSCPFTIAHFSGWWRSG